MTEDYRATAMAWVAEPDHRPMVEAIAKHLHANESLHEHHHVEHTEPCSYCWLRAAKAVQAIERSGQRIVANENARLPERPDPTEEDFAAAIERLDQVYGSTAGELIALIETVRDDETLHVIDNEARECVDDCTGCLTEGLALAAVNAVKGGEGRC